MPQKKDTNIEGNAWKDYLLSIEKKPQKPAKKGDSIGQKFKSFLERVGIGRAKKDKGEEIKKQVEISAKEAKKWPIAKRQENKPAVKNIYTTPKIVPKTVIKKKAPLEKKFLKQDIKAIEKKPADGKPGKKTYAKKSRSNKIEKYIAKIEKKQKAEKKGKELEELQKRLVEKRRAEESKKKFVKKTEKEISKKSSLLPKKKKGKKKSGVSKKISFMPKAEKKQVAKGKETKAKKIARTKLKEPVSERVIATFFKSEPSLAKKSIEEIKKLSPTQIKKEVKKERIEKRARGWYGDSLKHKKAAVSGWRFRKKIKLHQLRKKERTAPLTNKDKIAKKRLINEDKELRLKMQELDQKIRSLKKIAIEKNKENKVLEKKIKEVGFEIPKSEAMASEKEEGVPERKEDMRQIVQVMKKIANEMATTASRQKVASVEEEAMPIEDNIRAQEKLIKNLERGFYKRKVDFNQFREKMFDYQSKLTEMKIRKKIHEEKLAGMTPEMRKVMEERIEARIKGKDVGLTQKTADALEKMATKKETAGLEEKTAEAIRKIAAKETERAVSEEKEKRFAEKTASALEKIASKLGNIQQKAPGTDRRPAQEYPRTATVAPPSGKDSGMRQGKTGTRPQQPSAEPYRGQSYQGQAPAIQPYKGQAQPYKGQTQVPPRQAEPQPYPSTSAPASRSRRLNEMPKPAADFYDEKPVKKKGFLGKIKEKVAPRQAPVSQETGKTRGKKAVAKQGGVAPEVHKAISEKAAASSHAISKEQIDRVEEKLGKLLQKYDIPNQTLATHIKTLDSDKLEQDLQKLIRLIETKREGAVTELIRPAAGFDIESGIISKKKERITGKEKEIRRAKIETSFDRLLNLVKMKGIINVKEAAAQSDMTKKEVQECAEILERSRLIKLSYPPIGPVKLIYPAYLKWKLAEKKKKQEAKKKHKK